jgi:transcriptional regulator with PAS, ATPase and Fis domain
MGPWINEFPSAITVCDQEGKILFMNQKAQQTFAKYGGEKLLGQSLYDCHNSTSQEKIRNLLKNGGSNIYTIEKKGEKKLIYQSAWWQNGVVQGLVEISIILPTEIPHFVRD